MQQVVIELFNDYSSIASEAKRRVKYGKGPALDIATRLKILSPKQMLQRLPIALAQVQAGNTSQNLLYEIRQKFLKKYATINSIKL